MENPRNTKHQAAIKVDPLPIGWFQPNLKKYATVKLDHEPPRVRDKKKCLKTTR